MEAEKAEEEQQTSAEPVETTEVEEETVEMVDWETWASQEGRESEDLYMVVWNEKLGKQEIIQPYEVTQEVYVVEEGDRFAIPYQKDIYVAFRGGSREETETIMISGGYTEIKLEVGKCDSVYLFYPPEKGNKQRTFLFMKN